MGYKLIEVDPRELVAHEGNVRTDHGDLTGMVETMRQVGVVQPLHVVDVGNGTGSKWAILAGRRRAAAAIKAGLATVPCLLREDDDEGGEIGSDDRVRSLVENVQRKDLTAVEEAEGWRQLEIAGLDVDTIAKVAGVEKDRVSRGLSVGASKIASAVAKKYDLTLEQAVTLAEFDDDKEAVKQLTAVAVKEPGRFPHLASRMRQDRDAKKALRVEVEKVQAKGVDVYEGPIGYGDGTKVAYLYQLKAADKSKLTAAAHKKCPGHAAQVKVDYQGKAHVEYLCLDSTKHGHKSAYSSSGRPADGTKEAEKAKEERRKTLAENKEWRAAEPVRRTFIKDLLARKTAPKGVLRFAAMEILGMPETLAPMSRGKTDEMLTELTGVEPQKANYSYNRLVGLPLTEKATEAQLPLVLLAQVAAVRELGLDAQGARMARTEDGRWLSFLQAQGYTLSAVEIRLVAKAGKRS